jgi:ribosome-binding protein aMBF1 (putative translation factor)
MSMAEPLGIFWDHGEGGHRHSGDGLRAGGYLNMSEHKIQRVSGQLTGEQRARHRQIREHVRRDKPHLTRDALGKKAELTALEDAMAILVRERKARGLSLGDVAERSGIDKSRMSKLETDPRSNPTLATLTRIAFAIGVKLAIHVDVA